MENDYHCIMSVCHFLTDSSAVSINQSETDYIYGVEWPFLLCQYSNEKIKNKNRHCIWKSYFLVKFTSIFMLKHREKKKINK